MTIDREERDSCRPCSTPNGGAARALRLLDGQLGSCVLPVHVPAARGPRVHGHRAAVPHGPAHGLAGEQRGDVRVAHLVGHRGARPRGGASLAAARGRTVFSQLDRQTPVSAGEMVLYDTSHPFSIETDSPYDLVVLECSRLLLGLRGHDPVSRLATPLRGDIAQTLVAPFLTRLARGLADGTVAEGDTDLGESAVYLLRALCTDGGGCRRPAPPAGRRSARAHQGPHRGAPRRPRSPARRDRRRPLRVHPPSAEAVQGRRRDGDRLDPRAAARGLPARPARPRARATRRSSRSRRVGGSRTRRTSAGPSARCTGARRASSGQAVRHRIIPSRSSNARSRADKTRARSASSVRP